MNSLIVFSLIALGVGGHQSTSPATSSSTQQPAKVQQPAGKLSILGPNMSSNPRPMGIRGIKSIQAGQFKLEDFAGHLAGPGTTTPPTQGTKRAMASSSALVLYDSSGTYGWIGALYAYQTSNLLSHFGLTVTRQGVENYKSGQLANYTCSFYIGTTYYNTLPAAFKKDVVANTKPFCWMGYNIWEVAWTAAQTAWNSTFTNTFGFQFYYLDGTAYPNVTYKGTTLTKDSTDNPGQGDAIICNPLQASVVATSTNGSTTEPYITRGENFWYIGDNPMEYVPGYRGDDRFLAFCDVLNDIVGVTPSTEKNAVLRIEDVSAICDSASLRGIADTLYATKTPYVVCVIPDYKDPLGVFNNGTPLEIQLQNSPQFISDLQYMQSEGAQLIMHGVSHQYSNVPNPDNGVSAEDVEFFRVTFDSNGNEVANGPIPGDSTAWATSRLATGFTMMNQAGFASPTGWNTPHYFATPTDYGVFAKDFKYSMDRVLCFVTDSSGNMQYLIQPSPYVMTDEYGIHRLPETLGYCDPYGTSGMVNLPANMVGYANAISCVRGGWAGMYYHWFLGTANLQLLVQGVTAAGYTFVNPSASLN